MTKRRAVRILVVTTVAVAALAVLALVVVHTPWARSRALSAALARLAPDGSIRVERVEYWLPGLRFELFGVQMRTPGVEPPWFTADRIAVRLHPSALRGALHLREVVLENPRVVVRVDADGVSNLSSESTRIEGPVHVDRLALTGLGVDWRDERADWEVAAEAIDVEIVEGDLAASSLRVAVPVRARFGGSTLEASRSDGKLGWNGLDLLIERLRVAAEGAEVGLDGRVDRLLDERKLDLSVQADLDLGILGGRAGMETPPRGTLSIDSTVTGTLQPEGGAAPVLRATVDLASAETAWAEMSVTEVRVRLAVESDLELESASAGFAGGRIEASGRIALDAARESRIEAMWTDVSVAELATAAAGPNAAPAGLAALANGSATVTWPGMTPSSSTVQARLSAGMDSPRGGPLPLLGEIDASFADGGWTADATLAVRGAARLGLRGLAGRAAADGEVTGNWEASIDDLEALARAARAAGATAWRTPTPIAGRVEGSGTLAGTLLDPVVRGRLTVADLSIDGGPPLQARADVVAGTRTVTLDEVVLATPAGVTRGAVELVLDPLSIAGTIRTEGPEGLEIAGLVDLVPAELRPPDLPTIESGRLHADLSFTGPLPFPDVAGTFSAEDLRAAGYGPARIEVGLETAGGGTRIRTAVLEMGGDRLTLGGRVARDLATVDLMATARVDDAAALARRPELEGLRAIVADAGIGYDATTGEITVDLWQLRADVGDEPLRTVRPARLVWDGATLGVEDLEIALGGFQIDVEGGLRSADAVDGASPARLLIDLSGDLAGIGEAAEIAIASRTGASAELELAGALAARAEVTGTFERPEIGGRLDLEGVRLQLAGYPALDQGTAAIVIDTRRARLESLEARMAGAHLAATGEFPLALLGVPGVEAGGSDATLEAEVTGIGPAALVAWNEGFDPGDLVLELALRARLTAAALDPSAVDGVIEATALRIGSSELTLVQARPTRISLADGVARVESWEWLPADSTLTDGRLLVDGTARLDGDRALDLRVRGDVRLAPFTALLPAGAAVDGRIEALVEVGGTLAAPVPDGRVDLHDLALRLPASRLAVTRGRGSLTFDDGTLSAGPGLTALLNGSDALLTAEIDLADPARPTGLLGLSGRSVPFEVTGVRVNTDIDLSASLRGETTHVFGSIRLLEGGYRTRQTIAGAVRTAAASVAASAAPTSGSPLETVTLDVRLVSSGDLVIDAPFASAAAAVNLRITGTAARPGAVGDLDLREGGRIVLNGVTYTIERGRVELSEPTRIAPTLDLEAGTRIGRYEVQLGVSGDAFAPAISATSDPGLPEADVLSLMATGRTIEEASAQGTQVLREQAFAMLTDQLGGVTRALGLDSVRVEQGQGLSTNPFERPDETDLFPRTVELSTRLTLSRHITNWFDLTFSQNLGETGGQSWVGAVDLPRSIEVRAGTFDDDSRTLDLRHGLVFGRAPEDSTIRRSSRVSGVAIEGELGLPRERLAATLGLTTGDRFDFLDWQHDQDRLREELIDAGFREAEVRARRAPAGDPDTEGRTRAWDLVYEVQSGPPTRLRVVGVDLDDRAIEEIEQAWVDSLAADFLLEDLRRASLRALTRAGWLAPAIEVTVVSLEPTKEIRVEVAPGGRSDGLRLEIEGNRGLSDSAIRERLRADDALDAVWFEPARTAASVRELYRELGWLEAEVTVTEPALDAGRATARVEVSEARRYTLGAIEIVGADAVPAEALREAARPVIGTPFTAVAIDDAVARIVARYYDYAYNEARVTSAVRPVRDTATVELTVRVEEGARQVLSDVSVTGRHRTRASVVDRAVGAAVGAPIGAREVERVRRRLYQAGAFRSVSARLVPSGPVVEGDQPVRLEITVVEVPAFELRYGVQVLSLPGREGRSTEPGLSGLLTHRNFLGIGATASVLARARADEVFGRGTVTFQRLLGAPIRTTLLGQQSRRDESRPFELPDVRRTETVLQLQQSVDVTPEVVVGYTFNYERSLAEDPISPFPPVPTVVTRLSPLAIYDSRDDPFAPSRGLFHSSTLELALDALGSDLRFIKYTARQSLFVPFRGAVLATSVRFGSGTTLEEGFDTLDSSEFYFAGGATTVRGYPEDSLGRTSFFGTFLPGGDATLVLNQEVRFPIRGWVHGVAFADAGRTFTAVDEIRLSQLAASVGAGLRLVTPYIILRLDYGLRLSDVDGLPDAARGRVHFGIGHVF